MSNMDQTLPSSLGAARPLPPSADIGPGGQSVGQAAQFCLGRLALQVFRIKPVGEKPESAGLAHSPWAQCDLLIRDQASRRGPCASAFLTSDCEIPNCLAIAEGLTPALKAARTAFSLPVVNESARSSAASWRRCVFASATGFSFAGLGGRRPRRSASVVTAASSASISTSSNRFSAPAKSVGKRWRCCEARLSGPALPFGTAEGPAVVTVGRAENRSGVVSVGRRGMPPTMPPVAHRGNSWQGQSPLGPGAWPTKCTTSISATVPMRGVKVISPHRPDDQRAAIYLLLAHVWTNCTGADKC